MGLRDIGATLPPGFRFYPSDEELVCHYLYKKISNGGQQVLKDTLVEIDLHTCEPWQLPEVAKLNSTEWYFFSFRDRKYATGFRTNRATTSGYWKATGKDRTVLDPGTRSVVGMRKTLVFYKNRAPNGIKTGWIMHEFRLENPHLPPKEDWVLCRVFHKAKGENVNGGEKLSPTYLYDSSTTAAGGATSPTLATSPPADNTFAAAPAASACRGYHHHGPPQRSSHENANINSSPLDRNYLQLCHHQVINHEIVPHSKTEDEQYEFFFDMSFGESNLRDHGISPNLDEMQFDDDNSMIFF